MSKERIPDINPIVAFLSIYTEVNEVEKEELIEVTDYHSFPKNYLLHKQGNISKNLALIINGGVRFLYINEEGEEQIADFAFEGEAIGEFGTFINLAPSSGSAITLESTFLASISHENFVAFLNKYPHYYSVLSTVLSEALLEADERNRMLRIPSSRLRYEKLLELRPEVVQRVPLTYIASYLRMALGTLSRVRAGKL